MQVEVQAKQYLQAANRLSRLRERLIRIERLHTRCVQLILVQEKTVGALKRLEGAEKVQ